MKPEPEQAPHRATPRASSSPTGFGFYAELPGTSQAVRQAREIVIQALGEDHPSVQDATLIVSELVSNAVVHSRSGHPGGSFNIAVEMTSQPGDLRIQVRDAGGPEAPVLASAGPHSEHNRGLAIIAALAAEWGTEADHSGRATWCRLSTSRRPAAAADRVPELEAG